MEIYLPPIFTLLLGIITIGIIYVVRIPIIVVAVLSLILVGYTLYIHLNLFRNEYRASYLGDALKSSASTIMVSAIIVAAIIYALIIRSKKSTPSQPSSSKSWFSSSSSTDRPKSSWFGSSSSAQPKSSWFSNFGTSSRDRDPYDKRQDYISALDRAI
jgi:hypothetical protein